MAKKDKKNKKQQPGDWSDDDAPKSAKQATAPAAAANGASDDEDEAAPSTAQRSKFSFASFGDEPADGNDDDDDDGGGLMSAVRASEKRKKDKKSKKKSKAADIDEEDAEAKPEEDAEPEVDLATKAPVEMTTDQLMEEEFGPVKTKGGKGKKGKKGKAQQEDFDEDAFLAEEAAKAMALNAAKAQETAKQPEVPVKAEVEDAGVDEEGEGVTKVLSKKEKEKLKKEKEKAKKKAQAQAKKASGPAQTDDTEAAATTTTEETPAEATGGTTAAAEEGEEEDGTASKNKKKKKKGAAQKAEEAAAAAKAAPAKKVPAHIAAMRAALEKQKAAEEEARKKEEEERRRIEEEEARLAEIERQKEEEKKRKKDKEKAKKEQLKKEGKYMTPKQKQEAAAAAARRDAMIASGQIKVEGLASAVTTEAAKPKKVSYGKKKPAKKGPASVAAETASPAPSSPRAEEQTIEKDETRDEEHEPAHAEAVKAAVPEDVKEDWEMSSEEEAPSMANGNAQEELDDWDAESSEEEEKPAPKVEPAKVATKAPAEPTKEAAPAKPQVNGSAAKPSAPTATPATASKAAPASKAVPAKAAAKAEESEESSEEDDDDSAEDSDDDDSDDDSDDSDSEEERISKAKQMEAKRKAEAAARREQQKKDAIAAGSKDNLRSPICCILGHVDTGKTKLLDKIRQTNVQEGEAGGITQQIGATFFPMETIQSKTAVLGENDLKEYKLPGLLIIDTPGHESFTNLRTRGSSICNIAVLVVDIMHGLEPQTLESIRLLRDGKTPFIVALNKIDRLYGWKSIPNNSFRESLATQGRSVQSEFEKRLSDTMLAFAEQGLNAVPYYDNKNFAKNVSLVPTSAHTGEGIPDLLMLLIKLTQERMSSQLMYISNLECTVLEVKVIEGLGTTLDVILVNGVMREGDKIVVCGLNGPIVTQVRALLTPQPLKELRIKGQYVHHQVVKASLGIKIVAPDLDKAIAGSRLLVVGPDDDEEDMMEEVMEDLQTIMKSIDRSGKGVYVQASTLGALEALLEFLRTSKIPVSGINIGGVFKRDIIRAATMVERAPEYAIVLAFDVVVDKEASKIAEEMGVKIFTADIIYHLFDQFTAHQAAVLEEKRKDSAPNAVWPCRLKILKCFAKRDPIILGCDILEGSLRVGTPLCVVKMDPETKKKDIIVLGKVTGLEINHKPSEIVKKSQVGAGVAVKIEHASYQPSRLFGRHFDEKSEIISHISRSSIDTLKELFREEVPKEDWILIKKLKVPLDIQ